MVGVPAIAALVGLLALEPARDWSGVLDWVAPAGCPSEADLFVRLGRLLPGGSAGTSLRARARVEATDGGYALDLELESVSGRSHRRLQDGRCQTLATAAAFIVAVAIDPAVAARHAGLDPAAAAPPEAERAEPPPPLEPGVDHAGTTATTRGTEAGRPPVTLTTRARVSSAAPDRPGPRGALRLLAMAGTGAVPDLDLGVGLLGSLLGEQWRVELGFLHVFARSVWLATVPTAGADVELWTGLARACGVWTLTSWLEVPICGHLEVGAVRATGRGVDGARRRVAPWVAAGPAVALAFRPNPRVALWAGVHGFGTPVRPRFVVGGAEETLYVAPVGGIRGSAGVEVRFP